MQDNLRIASYWLTKDIREAVEVVKIGTGTGKDNAFIIKDKSDKYVFYFYGTVSKQNTFYRSVGNTDNVDDSVLQPLTNEYLFGSENKGYVRGWLVKYFSYDSNGNKVEVTNPNDKGKVRIVTFTLYGSYGDKDDPDEFKPFSSSAFIRSLTTQ